jgi:hypothetical protein
MLLWMNVAIFLIVLALFARNSPSSADSATLKRLERKVDLILSHLGLDFHQGIDSRLRDLRDAGQKIEAIKLYREQTGVGLKDAKDYVESL